MGFAMIAAAESDVPPPPQKSGILGLVLCEPVGVEAVGIIQP